MCADPLPPRAQLNELRSGIVRTACSVLRKLADEHHGELVVLVNGVLGQLLRNLYVTIKVRSRPRSRRAIPARDSGRAIPATHSAELTLRRR